MRWIKFIDGSKYTFAADIQKFAEKHGYKVPCESDGTRHPGTDCNAKMRTIFKDAGMRHTFKITEDSVVEIKRDESGHSKPFFRWLAFSGILNASYLRQRTIQLYTQEAVNALLSVMLKNHVEYEADETDEEWDCMILISKRSHSLEKKKNKPKTSLFKK